MGTGKGYFSRVELSSSCSRNRRSLMNTHTHTHRYMYTFKESHNGHHFMVVNIPLCKFNNLIRAFVHHCYYSKHACIGIQTNRFVCIYRCFCSTRAAARPGGSGRPCSRGIIRRREAKIAETMRRTSLSKSLIRPSRGITSSTMYGRMFIPSRWEM